MPSSTICVFTKITIFLHWCAGTFFQCNVWSVLCFQYHSQPSLPYHFSFLSVFPNGAIFRAAFACSFAVWAALHMRQYLCRSDLYFLKRSNLICDGASHLYNSTELLCMDPWGRVKEERTRVGLASKVPHSGGSGEQSDSSSSTALVQSKIPHRLVLTVVRSNRKGHFYG